MKKFSLIIVSMCIAFIFTACENSTLPKGMKEVHWDRDMCERCQMVVSERKYAVQILNLKTNKYFTFDDLGCAILWFEEENQTWFNEAKIWINDAKTGQWIDARQAIYVSDTLTPMGYGLSAFSKKTITDHSNAFTFDEAVEKIYAIDAEQKKRRAMKHQH